MKSEFSGIDFAVGSIYGHRAWTIDIEGRLRGITHTDIWLPGVNHAACRAYPSAELVEKKREGEDYATYNRRVEAWRHSHDMISCEHGYYAYFDGHDNGHTYNKMHVTGVIEAAGEVLIGTKGFRASKARVAAIALAPVEGIWRLESFVADRIRANYPSAPIFESELAMRSEFPCPVYSSEDVLT